MTKISSEIHIFNFEYLSSGQATESLGMHEMKQHKPWFDEECLGVLDQRKQAKMQWIQLFIDFKKANDSLRREAL